MERRIEIKTQNIPVDVFMVRNTCLDEDVDPEDVIALDSAHDYDEICELFAITDEDIDDGKKRAYSEFNKKDNQERIIILYECPHSGKKERHHPNYQKPLEVELLCKSCHMRKRRFIKKENYYIHL